ncbi:MAG: BON domain-containing protein [Holophaga sp.]|jgi:osmotically-inducible protein OsmY
MRHFNLNPPVATMAFAAFILAGCLPLPAAVADGQIEAAFRNSYNFKNYLKEDSIRILSAGGVVTLTGTVSQDYHKFLAQETASGLPGVKSVINQLSITGDLPSEHSDILITMKVKTALLFHKYVNASNTEVHTQDGVVILSGNADSEMKKRLTGEYAMEVEGVREVRNDLVVAPGYETLGEMVDDASITAQIKTTLLFGKSTHSLSTQVATRDGVVTLHGEAVNAAEKDLVGRIAMDIKGVTRVNNKMTLRQP